MEITAKNQIKNGNLLDNYQKALEIHQKDGL